MWWSLARLHTVVTKCSGLIKRRHITFWQKLSQVQLYARYLCVLVFFLYVLFVFLSKPLQQDTCCANTAISLYIINETATFFSFSVVCQSLSQIWLLCMLSFVIVMHREVQTFQKSMLTPCKIVDVTHSLTAVNVLKSLHMSDLTSKRTWVRSPVVCPRLESIMKS